MSIDLWKALAERYPNARPGIDYEIADEGDGRGPSIAAWRLPDPRPTEQEIATAITAYDARMAAQAQAAATLRQQILTLAQSAVGVRVDLLTAAQVRALFAVMLWQEGALNADLTVRPLASWADRS